MSLKLAQYLMATLAANWATYGGGSEMQSDAATDTLALYTMFGAIQQRHRRIIKMFYDCRHKEATQREWEGKTEKERWRAEQNKDSATEHKASFIMSSCRERRKTKKRKERRWTGASEADWTLSTHWSRLHIHIHSQLQLPHPLSTSTRVALS